MQDHVPGNAFDVPVAFDGPAAATVRAAVLLLAHLAMTLLALGLSINAEPYFLVLWASASGAFVLAAGVGADRHHASHHRLTLVRAVHVLLLLIPISVALGAW